MNVSFSESTIANYAAKGLQVAEVVGEGVYVHLVVVFRGNTWAACNRYICILAQTGNILQGASSYLLCLTDAADNVIASYPITKAGFEYLLHHFENRQGVSD